MSRKRPNKRKGKNGNDTHRRRRPPRRRPCKSAKKLARKLRRIKSVCTICLNTSHGKRNVTDCKHIFHRQCLKDLKKNDHSKCPNCREDFPTNTGHHQRSNPSAEDNLDSTPHLVGPPAQFPPTNTGHHQPSSPSVGNNLASRLRLVRPAALRILPTNTGHHQRSNPSAEDNLDSTPRLVGPPAQFPPTNTGHHQPSSPSAQDNLASTPRLVGPAAQQFPPTNTGHHQPSSPRVEDHVGQDNLASSPRLVRPASLRFLPTNTGSDQSPSGRQLSEEEILVIMTRPVPPAPLPYLRNQYVDPEVIYPNLYNSDIDLSNESSYSNNLNITHSVNSSSDSLDSSTNSEPPEDQAE